MSAYALRRFWLSIPTIIGAFLLVFFAMRLVPGDAVDFLLSAEGNMTQEQADALRRTLGLDLPVHEQLLDVVKGWAQGDFGTSLFSDRSVSELVLTKAPITLQLSFMATAISLLVGFPFGIISALRPNSPIDYIVRTASVFSLSAPNYWLALIAILVGSKYFGWFPPVSYSSFLEDPSANMQKVLLPAIILGTSTAGVIARYLRSSLIEVMSQDYIRTARSKGVTENRVIIKHALKNAMIPMMTILGFEFATILGGSAIIENIFSIPGMGDMALRSIFSKDYPVTQSLVLVFAVSYVYVNIFIDLTYGWFDPRIRY